MFFDGVISENYIEDYNNISINEYYYKSLYEMQVLSNEIMFTNYITEGVGNVVKTLWENFIKLIGEIKKKILKFFDIIIGKFKKKKIEINKKIKDNKKYEEDVEADNYDDAVGRVYSKFYSYEYYGSRNYAYIQLSRHIEVDLIKILHQKDAFDADAKLNNFKENSMELRSYFTNYDKNHIITKKDLDDAIKYMDRDIVEYIKLNKEKYKKEYERLEKIAKNEDKIFEELVAPEENIKLAIKYFSEVSSIIWENLMMYAKYLNALADQSFDIVTNEF